MRREAVCWAPKDTLWEGPTGHPVSQLQLLGSGFLSPLSTMWKWTAPWWTFSWRIHPPQKWKPPMTVGWRIWDLQSKRYLPKILGFQTSYPQKQSGQRKIQLRQVGMERCSVVKRASYCSRRPQLSSQYSHQATHRESNTLFWPL